MDFALAIVAAGLFLVRLALFVALHLVRSDYNMREHAVSDYAVGSTRRLSTASTWVTAAAWAALAGAVRSGPADWSGRGSVSVWLAVLALVFVALPFLPTDLEGAQRTTVGRLHYVAAIAWFAISFSLTGDFTEYFQRNGLLEVLRWVALGWLAALVIALVVQPLRRRFFAISERIFILAINLFYLVAAIALATR
jgi:hypothetical protein